MSAAQRIGKYEVQAQIGKGATGTVYRGTDGKRLVALKLINRAALQPGPLSLYRQLATELARLDHPTIAAVIELIESEKGICIVSELAEGQSLAQRMKEITRPSLRQAWDTARQILDALTVAHANNLTHGALTPANVIVDSHGRLKVTDFAISGLAAVAPATPFYTAPEQFARGEINVRTDLYQVGAIAYELVTGQQPFTGSHEEVVLRVRQEKPADPSSLTPKAAWQLDWVIQRALSKNPADRFGSAREFLEGLRLALQESLGTPLTLPPAPATALRPEQPPARVAAPAPKSAPSPAAKAAAVPPPAAKASPAADPLPRETAKAAAPVPQAAMAAIAAAKAQAPKPAEKPPEDTRIRVLFVDDEERVLNALRALFRQEYHVFTAEGGAQALEILKREAIQIVVSDQRMPEMTGVELLRQVKSEAPRAVRILLTGYSDLAALVGSVNEGEIFRYAKKPWDNDEMRETLAEAAAVVAKLAPQVAAKAGSQRSAGSLLVIDPGQGLAEGLQRLLAAEAKVHLAASPREAAKILQTHDVAAVVADLAAGRDDLVHLFKLLKAKRPETLSILVAAEPDSELVAELVNQAQIYRFLAKPVNARELRSHVSEALRRYAAFKASSERAPDSNLIESVGAVADRPVSSTA